MVLVSAASLHYQHAACTDYKYEVEGLNCSFAVSAGAHNSDNKQMNFAFELFSLAQRRFYGLNEITYWCIMIYLYNMHKQLELWIIHLKL